MVTFYEEIKSIFPSAVTRKFTQLLFTIQATQEVYIFVKAFCGLLLHDNEISVTRERPFIRLHLTEKGSRISFSRRNSAAQIWWVLPSAFYQFFYWALGTFFAHHKGTLWLFLNFPGEDNLCLWIVFNLSYFIYIIVTTESTWAPELHYPKRIHPQREKSSKWIPEGTESVSGLTMKWLAIIFVHQWFVVLTMYGIHDWTRWVTFK